MRNNPLLLNLIPEEKRPKKVYDYMIEKYVDLSKGNVKEICYEGFIDTLGKIHCYNITDQVFDINHS